MVKRIALVLIFVSSISACTAHPIASLASDTPAPPVATVDPSTGLILPPGYRAERVTDALSSPTHVAAGPDGALYLTQLNGGEDSGTGQVVKLTANGPQVVLDKLFKPTGLTFTAGNTYIVSGNRVLVSHVNAGNFDEPTPLFKDLPFNGRSEGQIFTGPDGLLYFQSTGNEGRIQDSGFIYVAKPDGSDLQVFARGFKNAYALAWDSQSKQMYATEIGDGNVDGGFPFPEELNRVHRGGNYGWPFCYADQKENHSVGGNRNICADTDGPITTFPAHATPTGLAVFDGKLIVALWNGTPPRLLSVDPGTGTVAEFASGFKRPIALLVETDRSLLVVDMEGNALWRLVVT